MRRICIPQALGLRSKLQASPAYPEAIKRTRTKEQQHNEDPEGRPGGYDQADSQPEANVGSTAKFVASHVFRLCEGQSPSGVPARVVHAGATLPDLRPVRRSSLRVVAPFVKILSEDHGLLDL